MHPPDITLPIIGVDYLNKRGPTRRFELALCHREEPVELRLEPNNPYDEHAVAVFSCRGVQLGYIPSVRAVRVTQIIKRGSPTIALFQEHTPRGGLIRISFSGSPPALPSMLSNADREPDFYPDEIWPDD